jgi:hypothetical protein
MREDIMHIRNSVIRTVVSWFPPLLPAALALIAFPLAAGAAVTFVDPSRVVQTFATVDFRTGDDSQSQDRFESSEIGGFDQAANCQAGVPGDQATSAASQLSYIEPEMLLAEGNIQAQAEIGDLADFAEAFGESRYHTVFSVDVPTEVELLVTLTATGNGRANFVFRRVDGEIFVYRSVIGGTDSVEDTRTLPPGDYELTAQSSGFGQAFPAGGEPAFGSFSLSLDFQATADVASGNQGRNARAFPVVAPNPVRVETRILAPARIGAVENTRSTILIVDLSGRVVRRFDAVGPSGILWDTRDDAGRSVPAGLYLVRSGGGASTRAVVLR